MRSCIYNNINIPSIGFGTWRLKGNECVEAVKLALDAGYRHIDTAQIYENEADVGTALKRHGIARDQVFVTTKVWMDKVRDGDLQASVVESLKKLQTDYADLILIHWPVKDVPFEETFRALQDVQAKGQAKLIGVSNFTVQQMKKVTEEIGAEIACNQVEYHTGLSQEPVLDYARTQNMVVTAYSPLGRGEALKHPLINEIAAKYRKTPGQVALRWLVQQENVCAIPKSGNPERIKQNIDVFDFELTADEMQNIFALARPDGRLINPEWAPQWDIATAA